jgi:hypothetical protein
MFLLSDKETRYPSCTRFIKGELQKNFLKTAKPRVFNAFEKACESKRFAEVALDYGSAPKIEMALDLMRTHATHGCGINQPDKSIVIAALLFDAFESSYDQDFTKLHLEATILHELVHWARDKAGVNELLWTEPPIAHAEAGRVFETWAYGRIFCTTDDAAQLQAASTKGTIKRFVDAVVPTIGPPPFRMPGQ